MSDIPAERTSDVNPLRAWIETADGRFLPSPRVDVAELFLGCDDRLSTAKLTLAMGEMDRSDLTADPALSPGDVLDKVAESALFPADNDPPSHHVFMGPNTRVLVARERPDGSENPPPPEILFAGICPRITYTETTGDGRTQIGVEMEAQSRLALLDYAKWAIIAGVWMRKAAAADEAADTDLPESLETPSGTPADCQVVQGVPCIFNPKGRGNCHRRPVSVELTGYGTVQVHVFCEPNDPQATQWTWAKAMRYLVFWQVFETRSGNWNDLGPIVDGNAGQPVPPYLPGGTFETTETELDLGELGNKPLYMCGPTDRPQPPATRANAFAFAVLGEPRDWVCEGLTAREALVDLAATAGLHFCERAENYATDPAEPWRNRLYWWARGSGPIKDLHRDITWDNQAGKTAAEILAGSNVNQMALTADYADVTPNPYVLGAVRKYEVTTELVPGWEPDANLDNVESGDVDAKLAYAEAHWGLTEDTGLAADPWYAQYHRKGLGFGTYAKVGRKWIANFSGRYRPNVYARTVGPFLEARYAPWEPNVPYGPGAWSNEAKLNDGLQDKVRAEGGGLEYSPIAAGAWARIDRPFEPCFAADPDQRSLGILVEWSVDSGAHWKRLTATTRALAKEGAIVIDADDLTAIVYDDQDKESHFWGALVRNTLRLRVTAVIAGDQRLEPDVDGGPYGPAVTEMTSRLFDVADRFLANDIEAGNSIYRAGCTRAVTRFVPEHRFELNQLQQYCDQLLRVLCLRQMPGSPVMPWLDTRWSPPPMPEGEDPENDPAYGVGGAGYRVGDCLRAITGYGINFRGGSGAVNTPESYTDIVGKQMNQGSTTLLLEDFRFADTVLPKNVAIGAEVVA